MRQLRRTPSGPSGTLGLGLNRHVEREGLRRLLEGHGDADRPLIVSAVRLCNYDRIVAAIGRPDTVRLVTAVTRRLQSRGIGAVFHVGAGRLAFVQTCPVEAAAAFLHSFLDELKREVCRRTDKVLPVFILAYVEWSGGDRKACDGALQRLMFALIQTGRAENAVVRFEEAAFHQARLAFEREAECARAFRDSQFRLHFQPIVAIDRRIVGAEGLLRWQHPELGLLAPGSFIATVEESDLFTEFGCWTIEQACRALKDWSAEGLPDLEVSINLTARDLLNADFVDRATAIVAANGLGCGQLQLELTERVPLDAAGKALRALESLKDAGFHLALDDFGTGLSDLQQLRHGLFETLKIDKSFIDTIGDATIVGAASRRMPGSGRGVARSTGSPQVARAQRAAVIYTTLVDLADRLGLSLIAEGVETQAQFGYLEGLGVTRFQGYLFGRAMPPEQFAAEVRSKRACDPS